MSKIKADAAVAALQAKVRTCTAAFDVNPAILRQVLVANTPKLGALLASRDRATVLEAAREAGGRRVADLIQPLTKVALGKSEAEALAAVDALAAIGGTHGRASLRKALRSKGADVSLAAAVNLAEAGDPSGKAILLKRIHSYDRSGWFHDPVSDRRVGAALLNIGYGRKRSELHDLLTSTGQSLRTEFPVIARKGWPSVNPEMRALVVDLKQYHGMRKWAAVALGEARDGQAVNALSKGLADPVPDVRAAAATALGQIGNPSAVPALEKLRLAYQSSTSAKELQARAAALRAIEAITRK